MLEGVTVPQSPFHGIEQKPSLPVEGQSFKKPKTTLGIIILNFTPSWFTINMGTGIVSILLYLSPHSFRGLHQIALAFYILNILLFLIFAGMVS